MSIRFVDKPTTRTILVHHTLILKLTDVAFFLRCNLIFKKTSKILRSLKKEKQ